MVLVIFNDYFKKNMSSGRQKVTMILKSKSFGNEKKEIVFYLGITE